ncbi:MAG: hypothetical protein ACRD2L_17730, partial [Terriglobia bacterium]
ALTAKLKTQDITGKRVLLPQGAEQATPLSGFLDYLKVTPEGVAARKVLEEQGPYAKEQIQRIVSSLSDLMPGMETANRVLAAGRGVWDKTHRLINRVEAPFYKAAESEMVNPEAAAQAIEAARVKAGLLPTTESGAAMESAAGRVRAAGPGEPEQQVFWMLLSNLGKHIVKEVIPATPNEVRATELAVFKREADLAAKAARRQEASEGTIQKAHGQRETARAVRGVAAPEGSALDLANKIHASLMETYMKPLNEGAINQVFPLSVRQEGGNAMSAYDNFSNLYSSPYKYSPKDLGTVAANLRKVDPEAFPVLFKTHLLKQQEAIFKQIGGRDSPQAFGRFVDEVSGVAGSPQRKMFDEAMKNVALAKGQDPVEVVRGANDYINALRVMSREQGSL